MELIYFNRAVSSTRDDTKNDDRTITEDLYGYEDGAPDIASAGRNDSRNIYGYGTDERGSVVLHHYDYDRNRVPQRSSLKGSNVCSKRRDSIGCTTATIDVDVQVPGMKGRQRIQRRRSIEFCRDVRVVDVPKIPSEYGKQVWLQSDEFERLRMDRRELRQKMERGDNVPWEDESIRGLETGVDNIKSEVKLSWTAVFEEQDAQGLTGDYDQQRIADAYKMSGTSTSQINANYIGRLDELEVRRYLRPRTSNRKKKRMRRSSC